ncbi:MAG: hypothetical protein R3330_03290 [Saprospiraceae bacterium]|nr:hypothetical protein [Saprospiraceae bacterium]
MQRSLSPTTLENIYGQLSRANAAFRQVYPGERPDRQPVHTVYGGAHLFKHDTAALLGRKARATIDQYAPDFVTFGKVFGLSGASKLPGHAGEIRSTIEQLSSADRAQHPGTLSLDVYDKVIRKLETEPVEDFRIDFEDGFGNRSDEEEDVIALQAAAEVALGMKKGTLPPFIGLRIKPFSEEMKARGLRTLDLFLTELISKTGDALPENFIVMLPKVTIPAHITALVAAFEALETALALAPGSLRFEIMVETTQSIMDAEGTNPLLRLVHAGQGRCVATHFGTYDYTASCGITAMYQEMDHPVCDFAHHMTKVALAHTGIWLSDGATNTMPIGPHRGEDLTPGQLADNRVVVHRAWKKGYDHVRHSLWHGYYQGWDLNPAQLPARYAAVYAFFLESYAEAAERLRMFVDSAARATLIGDVFDDAATGQGLLNYFLRALNCGAITHDELAVTGLSLEEVRSRSFKQILQYRQDVR